MSKVCEPGGWPRGLSESDAYWQPSGHGATPRNASDDGLPALAESLLRDTDICGTHLAALDTAARMLVATQTTASDKCAYRQPMLCVAVRFEAADPTGVS